MPITYEWYVENHVIHAIGSGNVTLDDMTEFSNEMMVFLDSERFNENQKLHIMIDQSNNDSFPRKVFDVLKVMAFLKHEHMGWFILYGNDNPLMQFISQMVSRLADIRFRRLPDMESAVMHIQAADNTIEWHQ